jgi:virginiamycin B lyase
MLLCGVPGAAAASPRMPVSRDVTSSFRLPHAPSEAESIFPAPDGTLWFAASNGVPGQPRRYVLAIERITTSGEISLIADHLGASGFAKTADGNVWFTGSRFIGRFSPDGALTKFPMPESEESVSFPEAEIVVGADGNLWFSASRFHRAGGEGGGTSVTTIDRMTPAGELAEFDLPAPSGLVAHIAAGPEGNIWFTAAGDRVGKVSMDGAVSEFQMPRYSSPLRIAAGPDGNLWFTESADGNPAVGRLTPTGQVTHFPLPASELAGAVAIAAGPDGRLWFSYEPGVIGRIDPNGRVSRVELPDPTYVTSIAAGAEGDVWYTATGESPCPEGDEACRLAPPAAPAIVGRVEPGPLAAQVEAVRPVDDGRVAKVRIACVDGSPSGVCRGLLKLRLDGAAIGKRKFHLVADRSREFGLPLSSAVRARLFRKRHLKLVCTATVAGGRAQARPLRLNLDAEGVGPGEPLGPGRGR